MPRASARSHGQQLEADDVDDGVRRRHEECVAAELPQCAHGVDGALSGAPFPFEDDAANGRVDRGEVTV